jgi:hypothetical protein
LLLCKALFLRLDFGDGIEIPSRAQLLGCNLAHRNRCGGADIGIWSGSQGHAEAAEKAAGSAKQTAEGWRRS